MQPERSPQVAALGGWLLDVAAALLDPTDRPLAVAVAVVPDLGLQSVGGGSSSLEGCSAHVGGRGKRNLDVLQAGVTWRRELSAAQRFAYFERKVGLEHPLPISRK